MEPGDIAVITGLINNPARNGMYVEILTAPEARDMPTSEGIVHDVWVGCEIINTGETGYFKPQNLALQPGDRRSVCLHLFGWEERP